MDDQTCFVCGAEPHPDTFNPATGTGHNYWSTAAAMAKAAEHDQRAAVVYSNGATNPEANYVEQWIGR